MSDKPDLKRAMTTYAGNMKEDLAALWKVWVPSTFVNFAVSYFVYYLHNMSSSFLYHTINNIPLTRNES